MTLYEFLKLITLLLILGSIAPYLIENIKKNYNPFLEQHTKIGILTIKENFFDSSACIKHLNSFFKNPSIKGIVLSIDCVNCSAGTSNMVFHEIQQLKKEYPKPTITLIENICLSGSYLIASASDYIIATESSLVGGIGSYKNPHRTQQLIEECAINYSTKKYNYENNKDDENLKIKQHETYEQCTKLIATARKLSLATVSNWAGNKIFTGKQALAFGLINAIGSMHTVTKILKERALIDSEIEWIEKDIHYSKEPLLISDFKNKVQYCKELKSNNGSISIV